MHVADDKLNQITETEWISCIHTQLCVCGYSIGPNQSCGGILGDFASTWAGARKTWCQFAFWSVLTKKVEMSAKKRMFLWFPSADQLFLLRVAGKTPTGSLVKNMDVRSILFNTSARTLAYLSDLPRSAHCLKGCQGCSERGCLF